MNQPDKDTEIEELKREIRELKEKVQTFESDQNVFKKHKKRFSVNLLTLILKLLADGLNAYQVHRTLMRLKNALPCLESADIPSRRYISDLRLSMQCLNKYKEMEFVQNAKMLTLSMDESPSSKGDKSFQIGAFNEKGEYCILSFKEIVGGTADEIHDRVFELLLELFEEKFHDFVKKVKFMSSDSAHNQVSAIRKLIATFMLHNGGHMIYAIKCAMHSISNMEKKSKEIIKEVDYILNAISNGLGRRANPGRDSRTIFTTHVLYRLALSVKP